MNISKTKNGDELVLKIEGRLDTNTSPELEKELDLMDGTEKVILDFENLEYLSSAGLRIILLIQKLTFANNGSLTIKNVNKTIKDVFNITGFSNLINVE